MRKDFKILGFWKIFLPIMFFLTCCGTAGFVLADDAEPLSADSCEAPIGNSCWYVDSDAPDGGNGTFSNPYNSFEEVVGYMNGSSYRPGRIQGGDYLYVKGRFLGSQHDEVSNNLTVHLARESQGGSAENPTVITSYNATPMAVFDGEYLISNLIRVRGLKGQPIAGVRITNIAVTRAESRGIFIGGYVTQVEVDNIRVTEGRGDGDNGTGGGILFTMQDSLHDFTMRDSYFSGNHRFRVGGPYNVGAINILSEPTALDGSIIRVFGNEIDDEDIAIRHKHSGNIATEIFKNSISNAKMAFHLRSKSTSIYKNLVRDSDVCVFFDAGNQNSDIETEFFKNTVLDTPIFVHTGTGNTAFRRHMNFYDNIYSLPMGSDQGVIFLGRYSQTLFDITEWQSANNIYDLGANSTFLLHQGQRFDFLSAQEPLRDYSSFIEQPQFVSAATGDFRLVPRSPGTSSGVNSTTVGAFPEQLLLRVRYRPHD